MTEPIFYSMEPNKLQDMFDVLILTESIISESSSLFSSYLTNDGFIIYSGNYQKIEKYYFDIIFQSISDQDSVFLLRKPQDISLKQYAVINISNHNFSWLEKIKALSESEDRKIILLISQGEENTGLFGLMKCLLTEPSNVSFRSMITDCRENFSLDIYKDQLKKNLTFNVLREKNWGTFVHVPIEEIPQKEVANASITLTTIGDLTSIKWIERPSCLFKLVFLIAKTLLEISLY